MQENRAFTCPYPFWENYLRIYCTQIIKKNLNQEKSLVCNSNNSDSQHLLKAYTDESTTILNNFTFNISFNFPNITIGMNYYFPHYTDEGIRIICPRLNSQKGGRAGSLDPRSWLHNQCSYPSLYSMMNMDANHLFDFSRWYSYKRK